MTVKPRTMSGVLELMPLEQITFQRMVDTIRRVFERFGFLPIETPAIELAEVLLTKTGGETERQMYFVQSTGSRELGEPPDLALRFDLTVPLARYVAERQNQLVFPFRRYQIQRVYRGESPQRGRFREFYQCDIDVVGRERLSLRYDAEMPAVIDRVFSELAIGPFTIRINNRKLMTGYLEEAGVNGGPETAQILREIDKLDRRGQDEVAKNIAGIGVPASVVEKVMGLVVMPTGSHGAAMESLDRLRGSNEKLLRGIDELRFVLDAARDFGVPDDRCVLDLSIARGLDYYTGTVYETTLDSHPAVGSICSGGRYDDLAGYYTPTRLPGVGTSIGLTRLFWQLREIGLVDTSRSLVDVLVTLMEGEGVVYSQEVARSLRQAGFNTEAMVEPGKLGNQLKYADRAGIRFVVIAGSEEREARTVTLRDLQHQHQVTIPLQEVVDALRQQLGIGGRP